MNCLLRLWPVFVLLFGQPVSAEDWTWPRIALTELADGFTRITDVQSASDGSQRLYVVTQRGKVEVLSGLGDGEGISRSLFLDLESRVSSRREKGLWGIAFPPDFAARDYFYVFYSRSSDGISILSRFALLADSHLADLESEEVIMEIAAADFDFERHRGGQIGFGPDGFLYLAVGDYGISSLAQNTGVPQGSILRIDVEGAIAPAKYAIPDSNPFSGSETSMPELIFSGLRNPWRFSFDTVTGDLFIADVGNDSREEVNRVPAERMNEWQNFGWPHFEGSLVPTGALPLAEQVQPLIEHRHVDGVCSVIGGYVYRGPRSDWNGHYLYTDFCDGKIRAARDTGSGWVSEVILNSGISIATFGQGEDGTLYAGGGNSLFRIDAQTKVTAPQAKSEPRFPRSFARVFEIGTDTPGALITYSLNGSEPTESDPVVHQEGEFVFEQDTTLKLRAFLPGLEPSDTTTFTFSFPLKSPSINPDPQAGGPRRPMILTHSDPGAVIRFETGGLVPDSNSPVFDPSAPIIPDSNTFVVKAFASIPGQGDSDVSTFTFNFSIEIDGVKSRYSPGETVDFAGNPPTASLRVTDDGSDPATQGEAWLGPQAPLAGATLRVLAEHPDYDNRDATITISTIHPIRCELHEIADLSDTGIYNFSVGEDESIFYNDSNRETLVLERDGIRQTIYRSPIPQLTAIDTTPDGSVFVRRDRSFDHDLILGYRPPYYEEGDALMSPDIPGTIRQLHAEADGSVLVASDAVLYRYVPSTGVVTKLADFPSGPLPDGSILNPNAISMAPLEGDNYFFVDRISRRCWLQSGQFEVSGLTGNDESGYTSDGLGQRVTHAAPLDPAQSKDGMLYFLDGGLIRQYRTGGSVLTLVGPLVDSNGNRSAEDYTSNFQTSATILRRSVGGKLYAYLKDRKIYRIDIPDADGDGIDDVDELGIGPPFAVGRDDRMRDSDEDGFSDAAEWVFGTRLDADTSRPNLPDIRQVRNGSFFILLPSEGAPRIQFGSDMSRWFNFPVDAGGTGPILELLHTKPHQSAGLFFRVATD